VARKTVVELVDDVDGGQADETVRFGLDGVDYSIDLSAENATRLHDILAPFVASARRSTSRSRHGVEPVEDPVAVAAARKAEVKRANREALKSIRAAAERTVAAVQAVSERIEPAPDNTGGADLADNADLADDPVDYPEPTNADRAPESPSGTSGKSGNQPAALIVPFQAAGP
jgi:hypothetical protein